MEKQCGHCNGTGRIIIPGNKDAQLNEICYKCDGRGYEIGSKLEWWQSNDSFGFDWIMVMILRFVFLTIGPLFLFINLDENIPKIVDMLPDFFSVFDFMRSVSSLVILILLFGAVGIHYWLYSQYWKNNSYVYIASACLFMVGITLFPY